MKRKILTNHIRCSKVFCNDCYGDMEHQGFWISESGFTWEYKCNLCGRVKEFK